MPTSSTGWPKWFAALVVALLLFTCAWRFYRLDAPVVDGFWDKQVAVANKARVMAGPPLSLIEGAFDFLPDDGVMRPLTEEIPLYHAIIALGYCWFGDQDWFARLFSALGSFIALSGCYALVKREFDVRLASLATLLLAASPLFLFYGRAVIPDMWMLAGMLVSAAFYRRYHDDPKLRWLLACGIAGLLGAGFKYYGLMVLVPLAEIACRRRSWRGLFSLSLWLPATIMLLPVAVWMVAVFIRTSNPAQGGEYFIFQRPDLLWSSAFWVRLFDHFLWKSCGPVTTGLVALGVAANCWLRSCPRPMIAWTTMGLGFYILLGPKSSNHEYYELMLLPAATLWAATGWQALWDASSRVVLRIRSPLACGAAVLVVLAIVQSPLVMNRRYEQETGFVLAARRLDALCSSAGRVVVGPTSPQPIIHYAHRQGWTWQEMDWRDWRGSLAHYQQLGAEYVLLYFNSKCDAAQRAGYAEMLATLPIAEQHSGPWCKRGGMCEFYVLRLAGVDLAEPSSQSAPSSLTIRPMSPTR